MQIQMQFDKIFDRWGISEVEIKDMGLEKHISLQPVSALHTGGRHAKQQFEESKVCIVELLINKLMRSEKNTGKKLKAYKSVKNAFDLIYESTGMNPLQVFVDAIQNAGPLEETIRLRFGGILVPKAVDVSSQRRIEQALRYLTQGAQKCAFKSKRSIEQCLADELIAAAKNAKCHSISKKEERERIARAAR
ncbi:MAG TPA: 30S ribosomal protein S7 [Candidatus Bathyarchaeia archaeon]|nr:30S ribosomal protein S7 [Candidatus Bathyarchaeia archaeon]